jgi:carbon monoxide dehydrogenase subunit G
VCAFAAPPGGGDIAVHVERDGNAFMVAAELTVAASTDEVWEVLTDFDHMAQILSSVDFSRVANRNGKRFDVIQKSHGSAGLIHVSLDSVRAVELTPKREIRSHLTTGDLKSSDFTTRIAKKGGVTRIAVRGRIVAEGLSAAAITPEAVQDQMQRQYRELREEILRRKAREPAPPCLLAKNCAQVSG